MQRTGISSDARKNIWSWTVSLSPNTHQMSQVRDWGGWEYSDLEFLSIFENPNSPLSINPVKLDLHTEKFDFGFEDLKTSLHPQPRIATLRTLHGRLVTKIVVSVLRGVCFPTMPWEGRPPQKALPSEGTHPPAVTVNWRAVRILLECNLLRTDTHSDKIMFFTLSGCSERDLEIVRYITVLTTRKNTTVRIVHETFMRPELHEHE